MVGIRQAWCEDRVFFFDEHGVQRSLPTGWTDAAVRQAGFDGGFETRISVLEQGTPGYATTEEVSR
jgi:hypothetical protein